MTIDKLTVVMLVGGRGSRLAPYTDLMPKCLIDVAGKPLLVRILDNLTPLFGGFNVNYVFLVDYLGDKVEKYVTENLDLDAVFLYDKPDVDQVLVVLEAKPFVTGAMLLYYGDTIITTPMRSFPNYDFAFTDWKEDVSDKGHVLPGGRIQEKSGIPQNGTIVVGGFYVRNGSAKLNYIKKEYSRKNVSSPEHTKYISHWMWCPSEIGVFRHISIDDPEDWVMANKYYKENEK